MCVPPEYDEPDMHTHLSLSKYGTLSNIGLECSMPNFDGFTLREVCKGLGGILTACHSNCKLIPNTRCKQKDFDAPSQVAGPLALSVSHSQ